MKDTTITLHTQFQIGQVDERIFGGFLEHMGRAVYEGVYDPKSAYAGAFIASAPVLVFYAFFQRRIIAGITMTGLAGQ